MDTAPLLRALAAWRVLAVATTVLALGSGAHVLGGGHAPSPAVAALLGALVLLGAAALARRPLSVRVLLPVALLGQLGVHVALTWLGSGAGAGPVVEGHHGALPALPAGVLVPGGAVDPVGVLGHAHPGAGPMLAAHVVAMVATVLLLVATERGVLGLVRRWSTLLPALAGPAPVVGPGRPRRALGLVPPLRRLVAHRGGAARRGPPAVPRPRTAAA
ncbi:hypothetical protein [Cellulomonas sp. NPDC058312]|uniref:hypothetical protein n=1 Tax=Cellulomonas sp. NPDC058312 TaxID=3346441 RepID=UPI0036E789CB